MPFVFRPRHAATATAVLFLALHLPALPASLEDLDSVNFALGLRHFDVAHHQPHPPGYPLYIAAGKIVHRVVADEATVLGLISAVSGALGVFALVALFASIDVTWPRRWAVAAAVAAVTCPLFWLTASRPLSDVPGLAAAIAIQALLLRACSTSGIATVNAETAELAEPTFSAFRGLSVLRGDRWPIILRRPPSAASDSGVVAAAFLAALATGIRSQVAWLTWPLLALALLRLPTASRARLLARAGVAFAAGGLLWAVPLVVVTGGPAAYWQALFAQGAEDLTGIEMLWTRPTPREALRALYFAFVAPWGAWPLAAGVLVCAAAGAWLFVRRARHSWLPFAVAFGPYLLFDVLFQETFTSRYALPLVPPVAYLATRAVASLPRPAALAAGFSGIGLAASISVLSASEYSMMGAPAFRLLHDMREAARVPRRLESAPVLAMHRREDLDLRRPLEWSGGDLPLFSQRLRAPAKHEWLELVKYWNAGGQAPVWFVADPLRTDLALIDRPADRLAKYPWPLEYPVLMSGTRPNEMDWHIFDAPGWYLGEGWALTPETAGVAEEDGRGPALAPIEGWIRRRPEEVTLMIGGRNLSGVASPASVTVAIDGRPLGAIAAGPGFYLQFLTLPPGSLAGDGAYARLTVAADRPRVVIEQFDAQSVPRVVFGFAEGWHEKEYNPVTGRSWRWISERGAIRLRGERRALVMRLAGETENVSGPTTVTIRVGDRVMAQAMVGRQFEIQTPLPADLLSGPETAITIESNQYFVPAERSRRTQDRRHLALRVADVRISR